ncbi:hypothetical protein GCM10010441_17760 [Kitasatospora paracochleata]
MDNVTARIRDAILNGQMKPGDHLVERQLAARLEVSNVVVRDAFTRLADEGFVVRLPRRGTFVSSLTPDEVRDLGGIRGVLERYAAELAISRWTPESHAALAEICDWMDEAVAAGDLKRLFELDGAFHEGVWLAARSPALTLLTHNLHSKLSRYMRYGVSAESDVVADIPNAHRRLLELLVIGDPVRAGDAFHHHAVGSSQAMIERMLG